jgi:ATP-binding cassette, subfamily B, bacterial PglK
VKVIPASATTLVAQLRFMLDREDLRQAGGLLLLMILGAALEMFAVAMIFPLIQSLANPGGEPTMPVAAVIYNVTVSHGQAAYVFSLLAFMVLFYIAKNLFFTMLIYRQNRFGFRIQSKISTRLFARYLSLPYTFHLQRNTAELLRNLTSEGDQIVWNVLIPTLTLITEALIAGGLLLLLLYVSFQAAIVISVLFGVTGVCFFWLFRDSLRRWGIARMHHDAMRIRAVHEGLGGLKELIVLGRTQFFLDSFTEHNLLRGRVASRQNLVQNSNLLLLEVLGVASLLILVGLNLAQGNDFGTILPMMGIFAAAAFRLIPATNRIIGTFQLVQYSSPVIRTLYTELTLPASPRPVAELPADFDHWESIDIEQASFRYSETGHWILRDVSLTIRRGDLIGFIGSSGVGKTTLVDVFLAILPASSGRITIDGLDVAEHVEEWQRQVGYIPQANYLVDSSIRSNVAFGIREADIDDRIVERALGDAQLLEFVNALPLGINTQIGEIGSRLSGGQRQRIGIARALYHDPSILVLDEATSSLDEATESDVMSALGALAKKKTILVVSHRLKSIRACDRVYELRAGRLVEMAKERI